MEREENALSPSSCEVFFDKIFFLVCAGSTIKRLNDNFVAVRLLRVLLKTA